VSAHIISFRSACLETYFEEQESSYDAKYLTEKKFQFFLIRIKEWSRQELDCDKFVISMISLRQITVT